MLEENWPDENAPVGEPFKLKSMISPQIAPTSESLDRELPISNYPSVII